MTSYAWSGRLATLIAAACLVAAPALAEVTVQGDQGAAHEAMAALEKLYALPGFRMKVTAPNQSESTMEFAPPDSYHMTGHTRSGIVEVIEVGDKMAMKLDVPGAPSGWQCRTAAPAAPFTVRDPAAAMREGNGTVEVSRGTDTIIDGTLVHTIITTTVEGAGGKNTIYIGSQTGLPRRVVSDFDGHTTTIDYYDYGAPIVITLPDCTSSYS